MTQTWKVVAAIIATSVVVGGGVYFWQQNVLKEKQAPTSNQQPQTNNAVSNTSPAIAEKITPDSNVFVLYQDKDYPIRFTTTKDCKDYYSVKIGEANMNEIKNYSVFVPGSTSWPKDYAWDGYSLFTQTAYDKLNPNEPPGRPEIKFRLDSGELFTWWSSQDSPIDEPKCVVKVEKL